MREYKYSILFKKKLIRLKGKELKNILKKRNEILESQDISQYKNLKYELSSYRRVHVNTSYIILFFDKQSCVYFVDYEHHDRVYNFDKKTLKKYAKLSFD